MSKRPRAAEARSERHLQDEALLHRQAVPDVEVRADLAVDGSDGGRITAVKSDGATVLSGTASVGPEHPETELDVRRARQRPAGELFIIDQLDLGMTRAAGEVTVDHTTSNGPLYPFSLDDKLARITEPHAWYTADGGTSSPWG